MIQRYSATHDIVIDILFYYIMIHLKLYISFDYEKCTLLRYSCLFFFRMYIITIRDHAFLFTSLEINFSYSVKYQLIVNVMPFSLRWKKPELLFPNVQRYKLICMNNRPKHLFNFLIYLKIGIFVHLSLSICLNPHPSIQKVLIYKEFSGNALMDCGYKKLDRRLGRM